MTEKEIALVVPSSDKYLLGYFSHIFQKYEFTVLKILSDEDGFQSPELTVSVLKAKLLMQRVAAVFTCAQLVNVFNQFDITGINLAYQLDESKIPVAVYGQRHHVDRIQRINDTLGTGIYSVLRGNTVQENNDLLEFIVMNDFHPEAPQK